MPYYRPDIEYFDALGEGSWECPYCEELVPCGEPCETCGREELEEDEKEWKYEDGPPESLGEEYS